MDRDIVQAAREGDPHAKAALGSWLCSELQAFFADSKRPEKDDLIQAALVDILKKLALAPDDLELLRDFVHSFAGMEVRESTRDQGRALGRAAALRQEPHTPAETPSVSVLGPLLDQQRLQLVIEHTQCLRPIFRDAILHLLEGGDYKSLAVRYGIPEPTAATRISRAIAMVSSSIEAARRTPPKYRTRPSHA
jgi:DNA-directed RNA polymerase specialized sigma24 family protein